MPLREIALIWVQPGVVPLTSYKCRTSFATMREAIEAASGAPPDGCDGFIPYIRAGVGWGAEIVNPQGIEMLKQTYNEGAANGTSIP